VIKIPGTRAHTRDASQIRGKIAAVLRIPDIEIAQKFLKDQESGEHERQSEKHSGVYMDNIIGPGEFDPEIVRMCEECSENLTCERAYTLGCLNSHAEQLPDQP
jgi:hypothetical protein